MKIFHIGEDLIFFTDLTQNTDNDKDNIFIISAWNEETWMTKCLMSPVNSKYWRWVTAKEYLKYSKIL